MYAWQRNALAKLEMSVGVHRPQVETAKRLLAKAWVPHFPEPHYSMGHEGSGEFRWSVDDRVLTLVLFQDGRYRVERTLPAEMEYSAAPDFHHDLMWLLFGDDSAFEHSPLKDRTAEDLKPDPLRILPTEVRIKACHTPPTTPGEPLRRVPKAPIEPRTVGESVVGKWADKGVGVASRKPPIDLSGLGDSRKGPLADAIARATPAEAATVREWAGFWMPIDECPEIGVMQCLSRCHCHISYRGPAGTIL